MFEFFKKKSKLPDAAEIDAEIDRTRDLADSDAASIWEIESPDDFIVAMDMYLFRRSLAGTATDRLTDAERTLFFVLQTESQIACGGFSAFFFNCPEMISIAADAFDRLGAPECAEIVRRAVDVLGECDPTDDFSDDIEAALSECDSAFYALSSELSEKEYRFALDHRAEFGA